MPDTGQSDPKREYTITQAPDLDAWIASAHLIGGPTPRVAIGLRPVRESEDRILPKGTYEAEVRGMGAASTEWEAERWFYLRLYVTHDAHGTPLARPFVARGYGQLAGPLCNPRMIGYLEEHPEEDPDHDPAYPQVGSYVPSNDRATCV